jgi:hypothetical protein
MEDSGIWFPLNIETRRLSGDSKRIASASDIFIERIGRHGCIRPAPKRDERAAPERPRASAGRDRLS